ncbi:MAG: hypothetical protein KGQ61_00490 [Planctomycetes bacterium]|nr:hypothetical protein [Planctomycetota bacterium]
MTGRAWWGGVVVAAAHFVAQVATMMFGIGRGLARFDHGGDPTLAERLFEACAMLLQFPLVLLVRSLPVGGSGQWGWMILLANSALWGVAATAVWRLMAR